MGLTDLTSTLPSELLRPIFRLVGDDSLVLEAHNVTKKPYVLRRSLHSAVLVSSRWHAVIKDDARSFFIPLYLLGEGAFNDTEGTGDLYHVLHGWEERLAITRFMNSEIVMSISGNLFTLLGERSDAGPSSDASFDSCKEVGKEIASLITPHISRLHALAIDESKSSGSFFGALFEHLHQSGISTFNIATLAISYRNDDFIPDLVPKPSFPRLRNLSLTGAEIHHPSTFPNVQHVTLTYNKAPLSQIIDILTHCLSLSSLRVIGGRATRPVIPDGLTAPLSFKSLHLDIDFEVFHSLLFPVEFPGLEDLEITGYPLVPASMSRKPYSRPLDLVRFPRLKSIKLNRCWPSTVIELLSCGDLSALESLSIDLTGIWAYYYRACDWHFNTERIYTPNLKNVNFRRLHSHLLIPILTRLNLDTLISLTIAGEVTNKLDYPEIASGSLNFSSLTELRLDISPRLLSHLLASFPKELPQLTLFSTYQEWLINDLEVLALPQCPILMPVLSTLELPDWGLHSERILQWICTSIEQPLRELSVNIPRIRGAGARYTADKWDKIYRANSTTFSSVNKLTLKFVEALGGSAKDCSKLPVAGFPNVADLDLSLEKAKPSALPLPLQSQSSEPTRPLERLALTIGDASDWFANIQRLIKSYASQNHTITELAIRAEKDFNKKQKKWLADNVICFSAELIASICA